MNALVWGLGGIKFPSFNHGPTDILVTFIGTVETRKKDINVYELISVHLVTATKEVYSLLAFICLFIGGAINRLGEA